MITWRSIRTDQEVELIQFSWAYRPQRRAISNQFKPDHRSANALQTGPVSWAVQYRREWAQWEIDSVRSAIQFTSIAFWHSKGLEVPFFILWKILIGAIFVPYYTKGNMFWHPVTFSMRNLTVFAKLCPHHKYKDTKLIHHFKALIFSSLELQGQRARPSNRAATPLCDVGTIWQKPSNFTSKKSPGAKTYFL